jgi:enoyl-CoA hydratase/carnithine racemase
VPQYTSCTTEDTTALSNDDLDASVSEHGLVARTITNRPESHNALIIDVINGLVEVIHAAAESEVRVVVVRGSQSIFAPDAILRG